MEILIFLGVLAIALIVVFKGDRDRSSVDYKHRAPAQPIVSKPRPPFDPKSAKPQPDKPELTGPARIVDGDTIVIQKTQIRLFGIDAPEMDHPYGIKAKWALVSLCKGRKISARITEKDAYGRTVAKCYLPDGRDLSAEMVKIGMAIDWPKFSGGCYTALEVPGIRKKLWLADARQKGRMHVWAQYEAKRKTRSNRS